MSVEEGTSVEAAANRNAAQARGGAAVGFVKGDAEGAPELDGGKPSSL